MEGAREWGIAEVGYDDQLVGRRGALEGEDAGGFHFGCGEVGGGTIDGSITLCQAKHLLVTGTDGTIFGGQSGFVPTDLLPGLLAFETPVVEDGGTTIGTLEAFGIHRRFAQFACEIVHIGVAVDQGADVECGDCGLRVLAEEVGGNALLVVVLEEVEHMTADLGVGIGRQREAGLDGIDWATTLDHAADGIVELDLVVEIVETTGDDVILIDTGIVDLGDKEHVGILLLDTADAIMPEFVGHHFGHVATEGIDALGAPVEQDVAHLDPSGGDGDGAIGILPRLDACAVGLVIHAIVEFDGLVPVVGRWGDCAEDVVACDFGWLLDVGISILGVFLGLGALILHLIPDERLTWEVIEVVIKIESLVGLVACTQILNALRTGDGVVLAGHMVGHKVHHDLETGVMAALDERFKFLGAMVDIVGDVGTDGIIVADGIGRAGIALDDCSRLAR